MAVFNAAMQAVLEGKNFATIATIDPDGGPQTSVVWYVREGDALLFSTTADRKKARNLARDSRISISVYDLGNPYHHLEIRGTAELTDDPDLALPKRMFQRYLGIERPVPAKPERRVIVRVVPDKVVAVLA